MKESEVLRSPIVIGVIGGIASGKSEVTRMFQSLNATIISADGIAHRVLTEPPVIKALVKLFGRDILSDMDVDPALPPAIDRKKLGKRVFGDSDDKQSMRRKLESIVHPRIRQIAKSELVTLKADTSIPLIILDAPLLIEGGWLPYCDRVVFVDSPNLLRQQRALERGWGVKELQNREQAQLSLAEKKKHATDILINDGKIEHLQKQVVDLFEKLAL